MFDVKGEAVNLDMKFLEPVGPFWGDQDPMTADDVHVRTLCWRNVVS